MADETTQTEIKAIPFGSQFWNDPINGNFALLKRLVDAKSDGVVTHLLTSDNNDLTLAKGVKGAALAVIEFKDSELVIVDVTFGTSIDSNKWVDCIFAPTSLFKGCYAANDFFTDLADGSPTHAHILCDAKRGAFPVFMYGNESGGIKDNSYAYRIFLLRK